MEINRGILTASLRSSQRPVFLCDFDGVINPHVEPLQYRSYDLDMLEETRPNPIVDLETRFALRRDSKLQPGREQIFVPDELLSLIDGMVAERNLYFTWLTLRGWEMDRLHPKMGMKSNPTWLFDDYFLEQNHALKEAAALAVIHDAPASTPFVWVDDIATENMVDLHPNKLVDGHNDVIQMTVGNCPVLIIQPDTSVGITRAHWKTITDFLDTHPVA